MRKGGIGEKRESVKKEMDKREKRTCEERGE